MSCCGQGRRARQRLASTNDGPTKQKLVRIEYLGKKHITVFSSASMHSYTFSTSPSQQIQLVDVRDAELLLRRRTFRPAI
jgi:hypothetical protein